MEKVKIEEEIKTSDDGKDFNYKQCNEQISFLLKNQNEEKHLELAWICGCVLELYDGFYWWRWNKFSDKVYDYSLNSEQTLKLCNPKSLCIFMG